MNNSFSNKSQIIKELELAADTPEETKKPTKRMPKKVTTPEDSDDEDRIIEVPDDTPVSPPMPTQFINSCEQMGVSIIRNGFITFVNGIEAVIPSVRGLSMDIVQDPDVRATMDPAFLEMVRDIGIATEENRKTAIYLAFAFSLTMAGVRRYNINKGPIATETSISVPVAAEPLNVPVPAD